MEIKYLEADLKKLNRNLTQMTLEQRIRYGPSISAFKKRIAEGLSELAKDFLTEEIRMFVGDSSFDAIVDQIADYAQTDDFRALLNDASRDAFASCDLNKFLVDLIPAHLHIRYRIIAPAWVSKCTEDPETGRYKSSVLDKFAGGSYWWGQKSTIWATDEQPPRLVAALPPTMELIMAAPEAVSFLVMN